MTKPIRRVLLYGGPGSGKSTLAHLLVGMLKAEGYPNVVLAREWIKQKTFRPLTDSLLDRSFGLQVQALCEQYREEVTAIESGAIVISDSPIFMQKAYAPYGFDTAVTEVGFQLENNWPAVHILLDRPAGKPYSKVGRWQSEDAAKSIDGLIVANMQTLASEIKERGGHVVLTQRSSITTNADPFTPLAYEMFGDGIARFCRVYTYLRSVLPKPTESGDSSNANRNSNP